VERKVQPERIGNVMYERLGNTFQDFHAVHQIEHSQEMNMLNSNDSIF